jgi:hypothetical protein
MATYTLDDIRAAAEAKYGEVARLLNPLRLSKEKRKELGEAQERLSEADDQQAALEDLLRLVAENKRAADRLLSALGGDLGYLVSVFDKYTKGTQAGEA